MYSVIFFASQTTIRQNPEYCSYSSPSPEEEAMKKGMLQLNRSYFFKRFRLGPYELSMFMIVAAATLVRFVLIYFNWPVTNSDEGNMGLLAMHVAYRGELPIFFYGLPYMGPLEGYIAAPLFHLFGVSLFTLRLGLLLLFALFLICMYYLTRLLYAEKFALAIVVLLSF